MSKQQRERAFTGEPKAEKPFESPLPSWVPSIPPMVIFSFALVSYIIFTGGVVYCTITGMPFVGQKTDERGNQKPEAVMTRGRGQYLGEGLAVGLFFTLGGVGFVMLDMMNAAVNIKKFTRLIFAGLGFFFIVASAFAVRAFHGMKDKYYFSHATFA